MFEITVLVNSEEGSKIHAQSVEVSNLLLSLLTRGGEVDHIPPAITACTSFALLHCLFRETVSCWLAFTDEDSA